VNTPESLEVFLMEQGAPVNSAMGDHIAGDLAPAQVRAVDFIESMLDLTGAGVYPPVGASEIDSLFTNIGQQVMFGQLTPEQGAHEFYTQASALLALS